MGVLQQEFVLNFNDITSIAFIIYFPWTSKKMENHSLKAAALENHWSCLQFYLIKVWVI